MVTPLEQNAKILSGFGLTFNQGKVYLTVAKLGLTSVNKISKVSKVPRETIYRILPKLEKKGLIEKVLGTPIRIRGIPIEDAISILIMKEQDAFRKKVDEMFTQKELILKNFKTYHVELTNEEAHFALISEKDGISNRTLNMIRTAEKNIDMVVTREKLNHFFRTNIREIRKATKRGTKIRLLLNIPEQEDFILNILKTFESDKTSIKYRYSSSPLTNYMIFDFKEALLETSIDPKGLKNSLLWTNEKKLVNLLENNFQDVWSRSVNKKTIENEVFAQKLIKVIKDFAYIVDNEYKFIHVNDAICNFLDKKPNELIGEHCFKFLDNTNCPPSNCPHKTTKATLEATSTEIYNHKTGQTLSVTSSPVLNADGKYLGSLNIAKDISENKRMEKELQNSEEKYKIFVENSNQAILVHQDHHYKFANKRAEEIFGYSKKELVSMEQSDLIHPEDLISFNGISEKLEKAKRSGKELDQEFIFRIITKDEKTKWVSLRSVWIMWQGKIAGLNFFTDITEQKNAKDDLKKSKEKIETYLNLAKVIMVAIDADGKVIYINKKGCKLLQYTKQEIIGKDWFSTFLPKKVRKQTKSYAKKLVCGIAEPVDHHENHILTKDGDELLISWYNSLLKDDSGNIIGTVSSGEDITYRKKQFLNKLD